MSETAVQAVGCGTLASESLTLARVDAALEPLRPALEHTIATSQPVVAMTLWRPLPEAVLLPFHLHVRWPDRVDALPLHWTAAVVPCTGASRHLMDTPLYDVSDAYDARKYARGWRHEAQQAFPDDFEPYDWEEGYRRHRCDLAGRTLAGSSYLAVGTVAPNGAISYSPRRMLGRYAARGAQRPTVLIPGRSHLGDAGLAILAGAPLCFCPVQGLRGQRTIETVHAVLARRCAMPTLIVAASPSDLFALNVPDLETTAPLYLIGHVPPLDIVHVAVVGRDRVQEEEKYEAAVTGLRGRSAALDKALDVVATTWWAARQSLDADGARLHLLPRVLRAIEDVQAAASPDAGLLTSALALLEHAMGDDARVEERRRALVSLADEHFNRQAGWRTTFVARNGPEAEVLRGVLAAHLGAPYPDLRALGVEVRSAGGVLPACDTIVATGYVGMRTIDSVLASGAREAVLLLDPIEARVASAHVQRMRAVLQRGHDAAVLAVLDRIGAACARVMAPLGAAMHLSLGSMLMETALPEEVAGVPVPQAAGDNDGPLVLISFTDGTALRCPMDQGMDVLRSDGVARLQDVAARDLQPGDEVVLIAHERQARFSEEMLRCLDEGPLRESAEKRRGWLYLAAAAKGKRSIRSIYTGLRAQGVSVDYQTVRSWLRLPTEASEGSVPRTWAVFRALADELGIVLPETVLRDHYNAVRRLRIRHRQAGRELVRLIRLAATHQRVDAATLYEIEKHWGVSTRDLLDGAHLCIVDDVTLL